MRQCALVRAWQAPLHRVGACRGGQRCFAVQLPVRCQRVGVIPGVQAKAMAPESEVSSRLRLAASALPLVLMVDKDSPYRDVMRGIELGAVDVLEKPLSSLKLRNIWQHVVRKV